MHLCPFCQASFTVYPDMVAHKKDFHWDDYLGTERLRTYEKLAAEGMIGQWAGADD